MFERLSMLMAEADAGDSQTISTCVSTAVGVAADAADASDAAAVTVISTEMTII